jgi:hypothetical protein
MYLHNRRCWIFSGSLRRGSPKSVLRGSMECTAVSHTALTLVERRTGAAKFDCTPPNFISLLHDTQAPNVILGRYDFPMYETAQRVEFRAGMVLRALGSAFSISTQGYHRNVEPLHPRRR